MSTLRRNEVVASSFRDPSGFLFQEGGGLYRQVNRSFREQYDYFISSGLYDALVRERFLIPHTEVFHKGFSPEIAYKVLQPFPVSFISYPYEWSFSQLKDAALLTLSIQKKALAYGMILKDASAFNIQFFEGKPILVDTLSFEKYKEGTPWIAYRQFCQHFLAPLALMGFRDIRLNQLFRIYIDGIPLDLASSLLPIRAKFSLGILSHIVLHAKSQKYFGNKPTITKEKRYAMKKFSLLGVIDSLESTVQKLKWHPRGTEWGEYYNYTNYSKEAFVQKLRIVEAFLEQGNFKTLWDLGANTGEFSRLAAQKGMRVISFDIDPAAVEKNYLRVKKEREKDVLPILLDLANPSPNLGWSGEERMSLLERGPADIVLALALIHHLVISNNVPFSRIAHFLGKICRETLIIEFIPKSDSNVQKLLATREDIFPKYQREVFEYEFQQYFQIKRVEQIAGSERTLYNMAKR